MKGLVFHTGCRVWSAISIADEFCFLNYNLLNIASVWLIHWRCTGNCSDTSYRIDGYHEGRIHYSTFDHCGHLFRVNLSKFARRQLSPTGRALRIVKYVQNFPICVFTSMLVDFKMNFAVCQKNFCLKSIWITLFRNQLYQNKLENGSFFNRVLTKFNLYKQSVPYRLFIFIERPTYNSSSTVRNTCYCGWIFFKNQKKNFFLKKVGRRVYPVL